MNSEEEPSSRISTKSRREYSEYTHLLRTLRAVHTEDITAHLTTTSVQSKSLISGGQEETVSENEFLEYAVRTSIKPTGKGRRSGTGGVSSNLSARWPLKPIDVQRPLYSLDDEVRRIARQQLSKEPETRPGISDISSLEEEEDGSILSDEVVSALTLRVANLLELALSSLVGHRSSVSPSLTNRLSPLGWQSLLGALVTNGAVDPSVIERSHERLSRLFPSTGTDLSPLYRRVNLEQIGQEPKGDEQVSNNNEYPNLSLGEGGVQVLDYSSDYELLDYAMSCATKKKSKGNTGIPDET